ncbi:MAG TPA: hypothetical protein VGK74_18080 [Symbiobacteriaceae bacterium]|jgi:hypothetical protein
MEGIVELQFSMLESSADDMVGGSWGGVLSFINTVGGYAGGAGATGIIAGAWVGSIAGPPVGTLTGAAVGGVIGGGVGLVVGVGLYIHGERR